VRARRKKKRNLGKIMGILSLATVMIVLIVLSVLYETSRPRVPRKPASEYFRFSKALAMATPTDETNRSIMISAVNFNITAVGGNATNVYAFPSQGYVRIDDTPYFEEILQGQYARVIVEYRYKVLSTRKDEGYPVLFRISCKEAEGSVTIYVKEFSLD